MTDPFKSGYVTLVGRPNVGKSTLLNSLVDQKVAAVSARPQTTRQRQLGILTLPNAQLVFMDTPGIHIPRHKLGEYMNEVAEATLEDADVIVWLVDATVMPTEEDEIISKKLAGLQERSRMILVLNKIDLIPKEQVPEYERAYGSLLADVQILSISARAGLNKDRLLAAMLEHLPVGEPFFAEDQITDLNERDIAADLIREAALLHLREEVPHAVAVRMDEFTERDENTAYIAATLFVEKESQKGIVIGRGGEMLKRIGSTARQEIEVMSGRKIFLELRVKVNKNWRSSPEALKQFGFTTDNE
jgi:GTPase